ncbi:hypothetical protein HAX54_023441 [Datura stramonium]|uniref:Acylsugar acyltransferase 3-like n=1 Tax=Datura stramonium TaxID=4076 RepID=A0ABS8S4P4_DATST|nr:hypothetical protein [Datura stramonium]
MDVLPLESLVSICDKSIIKPSSLTPSTLRYHKLSLLDQAITNMYIPLTFFYPKKQRDDTIISMNSNNDNSELSHIAHLLKRSLSQTLISYYPYAGRSRDNATVDCNDMGAEFLSVRINCPMSEILKHPHPNPNPNPYYKAESVVLPKGLPWKNNLCEGGNLLVAQVSQFDCGGIAISACLSHKIGDGCSVLNFFMDWARATRDDRHVTNLVPYSPPRFVGDSIFTSPLYNDILPIDAPQHGSNVDECIQKRFIFLNTKLDALRAKVIAESGLQNPTRAEIVSSLLFKCATRAASKLSSVWRPSKLIHFLNIRPMIKPRLPRSAMGNLLSVFAIDATSKEETELPSNLCKMPYYSVDFGWGKPERSGVPNGPVEKMFFLNDYQTGQGVEVRVTLQKEQMSAFECDEELLEFAL